ncbi:MAG: SpoIIIAH-like family protein [Vallitalea sp.]|jgi:stage III sporulation protein AH|nr:SpoIIIAH-like family protein [Vallitalea sp.]
MQTFKKNQIIITALVIMIAIAGYLQFMDRNVDSQEALNQQQQEKEKGKEKGKEIVTPTAIVPNSSKPDDVNADKKTDDVAKNNQKQIAASEAEQNKDAKDVKDAKDDIDAKETTSDEENNNVGEAVLTSANSVEAGHFLQAKIGREQVYSKLKSGYLAIIDNKELKDEHKVEAVKEMVDLHHRIEKEAAAESLLKAKGFKDVFVRMLDGKVDVVINAKELSQAELAQVEDVVRRKTGVDANNIVISLLDASKSESKSKKD